MYEGIEYRGYGQEIVEELAKYAGVPVWNGLTNEFHPTQMLADLLTIKEKLGRIKGVKLTYMGDARYNMGNSLMVVCAKLGMHFTACTSAKYFPEETLVKECQAMAESTGASITLTEDVTAGTKDADVIYTDVMGVTPGVVGVLMMAARFVDAVTDVTMGQIVDRSKPTKDGKFKPWIKRMCGPVAIASFLIYQSGFANMSMGFKVFWMVVTYILWGSIFYTSINIPYGSMASAVTADPKERADLSTWRTIGGTLAGLAMA